MAATLPPHGHNPALSFRLPGHVHPLRDKPDYHVNDQAKGICGTRTNSVYTDAPNMQRVINLLWKRSALLRLRQNALLQWAADGSCRSTPIVDRVGRFSNEITLI